VAHDLRVARGGLRGAYRLALRRNADRAAVPYGFTVLNAAAGGVLIRTHGPPSVGAALLFLCGAVAGFTGAGLLAGPDAGGDAAAPQRDVAWLGLSSGAAALVAFGACAAIAKTISGPLAFGAVALTATVVYLAVGSVGAVLIGSRNPDGVRVTSVTDATNGGPRHRNERRADVHSD